MHHAGVRSRLSRTRTIAMALLGVSLLAGGGFFVVVEHTTWYVAQQRQQEARQSALTNLVFESLYAVMRAGGGVEDLQNTILRLEERLHDHSLYLVRGESLLRERGDFAQGGHLRQLPQVVAALRQGVASTAWTDEGLRRSVTPVRFRASCVGCHTQASVGGIAAVIVSEQLVDRPRRWIAGSTLVIYLYVVLVVPLLVYLAQRLGAARRSEH